MGLNRTSCSYMDSEMHFTVFTEHKVTTMPTSADSQRKAVQSKINTQQQTWWVFSPQDFSSYRSVAPQPEVWTVRWKPWRNNSVLLLCTAFLLLRKQEAEQAGHTSSVVAGRAQQNIPQAGGQRAQGWHLAAARAAVGAHCSPVTPCAVTVTSWPFPALHPSWSMAQPSPWHRVTPGQDPNCWPRGAMVNQTTEETTLFPPVQYQILGLSTARRFKIQVQNPGLLYSESWEPTDITEVLRMISQIKCWVGKCIPHVDICHALSWEHCSSPAYRYRNAIVIWDSIYYKRDLSKSQSKFFPSSLILHLTKLDN